MRATRLHKLGAVQSAIRSGSSDHGGQIDCAPEADSGVRGIATGSSVRRELWRSNSPRCSNWNALHSNTFCPQEQAQTALLVRAADNDPSLTLLSIDGIGAYDHIFRSSMLGRLLEMVRARALLPFVTMSNAGRGGTESSTRQKVVSKATRCLSCVPSASSKLWKRLQQQWCPGNTQRFPPRYLLALSTSKGETVVQAARKGLVEVRRNRVASEEDQNLEPGRSCARQHWRGGRSVVTTRECGKPPKDNLATCRG